MPRTTRKNDVITTSSGSEIASPSKSGKTSGNLIERTQTEHGQRIELLENTANDLKNLQVTIQEDQKNTDDLVKLGWIVIIATLVGVAVSFAGVTVEFYLYLKDERGSSGNKTEVHNINISIPTTTLKYESTI